jgi:hypothetical protein
LPNIAADAERSLEGLVGTGAEAVERDGERVHANLGHEALLKLIAKCNWLQCD